MTKFWRELSMVARGGLVAGALATVLLTAGAAYWLLRTDYQVLFGDLTPSDASAMAAELERLKVPFTLGEQGAEGGTTILVDRKDVYRTRLKLMAKDIPLHGTVGFELFNNNDFGMTEFAQRVNYQRALQGELTRTILSLAEIRDARVLLALPEQGLFKVAKNKATASITLTLKDGRVLGPAQVTGLQRLVAAAVPGISAQDVTIVDQSGIALTRSAGDADGADASSARLDLKKEMEQYLARKAGEVLDRTLGAGQALASVDVTLDMDRVQTTTEDVLTPPGPAGHAPTGVVVRERETLREVGAPLRTANATDSSGGGAGGSSQRELEYAVGRRVEQVIGQPGSIRRLQVVAVVRHALDATREDQIRKLVAASVGAVPDRGDVVVVQPIAGATPTQRAGAGGERGERVDWAADGAQAPAHASAGGPRAPDAASTAAVLGLVLLAVVAVALGASRLRRRPAVAPVAAAAALSEQERRAALAQVQAWMRGDAPSSGGVR